jgi:flagellar basal-body rod protein FlgB
MTEFNIFDRVIDTAGKALDLRSRRHEVIISNVANADTPDYKAFDVLVEEALSKQTADKQPVLEMQRSHPVHLQVGNKMTNDITPYTVEVPAGENLRGDGNTVDMEHEMSNLASNQLMYKATAQILSKKFQFLHSVIQGSRR